MSRLEVGWFLEVLAEVVDVTRWQPRQCPR